MTLPKIDDMTQFERQALLFSLLDGVIGSVILPDKTTVAVPLLGEISDGGSTRTVYATPYIRFQPTRLLILEPVVERADRQEITTYDTMEWGPWWRRRKERVPGETRTIYHRTQETIPRGLWTISQVCIGRCIQFMTHGSLSGDAFGPDSALAFSNVCEPALSISVTARHSGVGTLPFRAVVLGKLLDRDEDRSAGDDGRGPLRADA